MGGLPWSRVDRLIAPKRIRRSWLLCRLRLGCGAANSREQRGGRSGRRRSAPKTSEEASATGCGGGGGASGSARGCSQAGEQAGAAGGGCGGQVAKRSARRAGGWLAGARIAEQIHGVGGAVCCVLAWAVLLVDCPRQLENMDEIALRRGGARATRNCTRERACLQATRPDYHLPRVYAHAHLSCWPDGHAALAWVSLDCSSCPSCAHGIRPICLFALLFAVAFPWPPIAIHGHGPGHVQKELDTVDLMSLHPPCLTFSALLFTPPSQQT